MHSMLKFDTLAAVDGDGEILYIPGEVPFRPFLADDDQNVRSNLLGTHACDKDGKLRVIAKFLPVEVNIWKLDPECAETPRDFLDSLLRGRNSLRGLK